MCHDGLICVISYTEQIPKSSLKAEPCLAHHRHHQMTVAQCLAQVGDQQILPQRIPRTDPQQPVKDSDGSENHAMSD